MKKFFIAMVAVLASVSVSAKDNAKLDLSCLYGQSVVNVLVDWSEVTIKGLSVDDWLAYRQADQPDYDAEKELEDELKPQAKELIAVANKSLSKKGITLVEGGSGRYTLVVIPQTFDMKGNNTLLCRVVDSEDGNAVVGEFNVKGEGGHWGSMRNLWSDGFKESGSKLGSVMNSAIKKK